MQEETFSRSPGLRIWPLSPNCYRLFGNNYAKTSIATSVVNRTKRRKLDKVSVLFKSFAQVLDFGCGTGEFTLAMAQVHINNLCKIYVIAKPIACKFHQPKDDFRELLRGLGNQPRSEFTKKIQKTYVKNSCVNTNSQTVQLLGADISEDMINHCRYTIVKYCLLQVHCLHISL